MICINCGRAFRAYGRPRYCPACCPVPALLPERRCPECGAAFVPANSTHVFCSRDCRSRNYTARLKSKSLPAAVRICRACGAQFETNTHRAYCSDACREAGNRQQRTGNGKDREFTELTVFLVHKYSYEGMSLDEIAKVLDRSSESVRRALDTPVSREQFWAIQHNAKPSRRKTKC